MFYWALYFQGLERQKLLGKLGAISALPGAFMTALSAGFSVFIMTKGGLPVSTSQAIVGAIIGWNFFSQKPTDTTILLKDSEYLDLMPSYWQASLQF